MDNLVRNLEWLMQRTGLDSQKKVADAAGVSQTHVGNILRREKLPGVRVLDRIAHGFGIEVWQLLAPHEMLRSGMDRNFAILLKDYALAGEEGRKLILQVAAGQAAYYAGRPTHPDK